MPKVTELWAWVVEDTGPDDEGVPAFYDMAAMTWLPMIGADRDRAQSLRGQAQAAADNLGKPLRLMRSTSLEEVYVLQPNTPAPVVDVVAERAPTTEASGACQHTNTIVDRVPPAWADEPYPAVLTTTCEDCGLVISTTDIPARPV